VSRIIVIKIGGATLGSHDTALADVVQLQGKGLPIVIAHGGAKVVTEWLKRENIDTRFVRGERVTDLKTLEMVTAVLGGLVNKEIVAAINGLGGRAVGISGVDGALIQSSIRDKEMGYTGNIVKVNTMVLDALLGAGFIPVVSPVSFHAFDRPDNTSLILNVNGDTVAGEIAASLGAEKLVFLTDVAGIRDSSGRHISVLSPKEAEGLLVSGAASGGMIPKIKACLRALSNSSTTCIIMDGTKSHALLTEIEHNSSSGTMIKAEQSK
jgi:acetylglutamate kinase